MSKVGFMLMVASEGAGSDGTVDSLLASGTKAVEFSGQILRTMIANPVYSFMLGAGLVGIGIALVRALKNAAR